MKSTPMITSFASGEFSPLMEARTDFKKYSSGCKKLENFIIHPQGPVSNRAGLRFVARAKGGAGTGSVALIPFIFSNTQAYIIEAGHENFRFYMDQGQIVLAWADATDIVISGGFANAGEMADWTALNSAAITSIAGGEAGNCCQCQENGEENPGFSQTIAVDEHCLYMLKFYVKQGTEATWWYEIYDETNSAIIETGATAEATGAWVQKEVEFYAPVGCASITIRFYVECAAASGLNCLFDTVELKRQDEPYEIATPFQLEDLHDLKYCQSADVMYITHPTYAVRKLSRTGHTAWTLSSPAFAAGAAVDFNDAANHYPSCCVFHENRLCFGNTNNDPVTIWLSKSGDFEDMTTGAADDDAIVIDLASDQVNAIQDLKSGVSLMALTSGGEWRISAVDSDEPITPTNVTAKRETVHGSHSSMASQVGSSFIFIQYAQRKLHELAYNWEYGGYVAPDLSVLAEHMSEGDGAFSKIAFQKEPDSILWVMREDGVLTGCTFQKEHDVTGWFRCVTDGDFVSIACIPGINQDELWTVVKRGSIWNIELMEYRYNAETTTLNSFYIDCGATITVASSTNTIEGPTLWFLAEETCRVLMDGATHPDVTVGEDGSATFTRNIEEKVSIGLGYDAILTPVRIDVLMQTGTSQGKKKAFNQVILRLKRTLGAKIGPDENNLDIIPFRTPDMDMDSPPTLLTGDTEPIPFRGGYDRNGWITIVQDQTLPITVCGIMPVMDIREED